MAYKETDSYAGAQDMATVDTTQRVPLGTVIKCVDPTYGEGQAIYLGIPTSTAIAAGIIVYANASLNAVAVPVVSTSKKSGRAVYIALNAVTSNSSSTQYTWFLKKGITATLKTAVTVPADSAVYVSTTAGRMYLTASAGAQILGARTVNAASVTSTTSTVLVQIDNAKIDGYA